jgi:Flp pilus assembly protein TadD
MNGNVRSPKSLAPLLAIVLLLTACGEGTAEKIVAGISRGQAALASGDAQTASTEFKEVLLLDPANVDAIHLRGVALERIRQWPQAYAHYARAWSVSHENQGFGLDVLRLEV